MNYCSGKGLILYDNYKRKTYEVFRGVALTSHKGILFFMTNYKRRTHEGFRGVALTSHKGILFFMTTIKG
jgi:hypothetical protein